MNGKTGHFVASRRTGFTLTELIVSIGILALMMSMAGAVFHLTIKSTGQARAVTTVSQRLREFERELRADLRAIDPEATILVIVPAKINAYWTAAGRDGDDIEDEDGPANGYPHPKDPEREIVNPDPSSDELIMPPPRADRLMFLTSRPAKSFIDPELDSGLQMVTYGHAIIGEWSDASDEADEHDWRWSKQYQEEAGEERNRRARFDNAVLIEGEPQTVAGHVFPIPAEKWHLARRSVLLVPYTLDPDNAPYQPKFDPESDDYSVAVAFDLDPCWPNKPGEDPYECSTSDSDFIPLTDEEKTKFALVQGRQDVVAYNSDESGPFHINNILYDVDHNHDGNFPNNCAGGGLYPVECHPQWYARSEIDLTPPALIASRLGHYFMPGVASFKVEFALDVPELRGLGEVLWIDPADLVHDGVGGGEWSDEDLPEEDWSPTRQRIERLLTRVAEIEGQGDQDEGEESERYKNIEDRFQGSDSEFSCPMDDVPPAQRRFQPDPASGEPMARWYSAGPDGVAPDPLFPVALRVTIDVYDDQLRLERPRRHVMVFEIGG